MKKSVLLALGSLFTLLVIVVTYIAVSVHRAGVKPVRVEDLNAPSGVIGRLGHTLSKIVTVEAEVFDGSVLNVKALDGVLLLRVLSVNGEKLSNPEVLRFAWLAASESASLKGKVKLLGYETGEFSGIPHEAFQHVMPRASEGFGFQSSFVVLKSL